MILPFDKLRANGGNKLRANGGNKLRANGGNKLRANGGNVGRLISRHGTDPQPAGLVCTKPGRLLHQLRPNLPQHPPLSRPFERSLSKPSAPLYPFRLSLTKPLRLPLPFGLRLTKPLRISHPFRLSLSKPLRLPHPFRLSLSKPALRTNRRCIRLGARQLLDARPITSNQGFFLRS